MKIKNNINSKGLSKLKWILLLVSVILIGCEKWDLEEKLFLEVTTPTVGSISIDSVSLASELLGFTIGQVDSHGFIWSSSTEVPNVNLRDGIVDLGSKNPNDEIKAFSIDLALEPKETYYMRAFAGSTVQDYVYSDIVTYTTGNAQVFSEDLFYSFGPTIRARGFMTGLNKGFVAIEHGFCWSIDTELPTVDDAKVNLGERRNNDPFEAQIEGLINDETHYIRAYAVVTKDADVQILYGEVMEFNGDLKSTWTFKSSIPGPFREGAVCFSIDGIGYAGLGSFQTNNPFWAFNPETNTWSQTAGFPGDSRWGGSGFTINGKGYISTGANNVTNTENPSLNDLWEYDPQNNSWERKADLPAPPRVKASVFVVNDKAYLGTGWNTTTGEIYDDLWEYDPSLDIWQQKAPLPGGVRAEAIAFAVGSKGYLGTGWGNAPDLFGDLWAYDPAGDFWEKKANLPIGGRAQSSAFAIESLGKGYLVSGQSNDFGTAICEQDIWSYDVAGDFWTREISNFPAVGRIRSIAFTIGDKGYFGTGGCVPFQYAFNDIWEYDP